MKYANQESKIIKPKQYERTDLLCIHEMLSHLQSKCRNISNTTLTTCLKTFPNLSVVSLPRGSHVNGIKAGVSVLLMKEVKCMKEKIRADITQHLVVV